MRSTRKRNISFILVFLISFCIGSYITYGYIGNKSRMEYAQMEQLVLTKANKINDVISKLLYKTQVLASLAVKNDGGVNDFERVAATVMDDPCIKNVIVAPDGVVKYVYPLEGNERVLGLDYFSEGKGNTEAIAARDTGELVLGGPFDLVQGGQALVGRLPVYLNGEGGDREFWGLVSVTLDYPDALNGADLDRLKNQGYAYEIWRISPDTKERQIIAGSDYKYNENARYVEQPVKILNADWYFRLAPIRNWYQYPETWMLTLLGVVISFLIAYLNVNNYDLKVMKSELEELIICDPLTGILNRRGVFEKLERLMKDPEQKFALCYLDLNKFKSINDIYGHSAGDIVLCRFVDVFEHYINDSHIFARIGGDEFVLTFQDTEDVGEIMNFFDMISEVFEKTVNSNISDIRIAFSVGIAFYPEDGDTVDKLIETADRKMYQEKTKKE